MSRSLKGLRPPSLFKVLLLAMVLVTAGLVMPGTSLAQDQVGVYWDPAYTESVGSTASVPGAITGYVVLHDATGSGGVLGWEACFALNGPATFAGWDFQGQGINAGTEPCVAVGYTSPLPQSSDILLATFNLVATGPGPIELRMRPDWNASLPGQMSYIPGGNPNDLIGMTTATGQEMVAGLNGGNPWVTVAPLTLDFGPRPFGVTTSLFVTITNADDTPLPLDLSITNLCDFFTLPGGTGPAVVPARSALTIEVAFAPIQEREVRCTLTLGPNLPTVALIGAGVEPVPLFQIIGSGNFGNVTLGQTATRTVTVKNVGQTVIHLDPSLPNSCPAFTLLEGLGAGDLQPGATRDFVMRFAPTLAGNQSCPVDVGHVAIPNLNFWGRGIAPVTSWTAPTNYNFLTRVVGVPAFAPLTIVNTGTTVIPLQVSLPAACSAFAVSSGGGDIQLSPGQAHVVTVRFLTDTPGPYTCDLDLGTVVPDIRLDATAIPSPGVITVTPGQIAFPSTLTGQTVLRSVLLTNTAPYDVSLNVALTDSSGVFGLTAGGGIHVLAPGLTRTVTVSFTPFDPIPYQTTLRIGTGLTPVVVSGGGYEGTADCRIEPESLHFGDVVPGTTVSRQVTITNDGAIAMLLEPQTSGAEFFIDAAPVMLSPGQSRTFTVQYHPTNLGPDQGSLLLGATACNAVVLVGNGILDGNLFEVSPPAIALGQVPLNTVVDTEILVTNLADYELPMNVRVLAPALGFSLLNAGGQWVLPPGVSRSITVRFVCLSPQSYATNLALGDGLPLVPMTAAGFAAQPDCGLSTSVLNFGNISVGGTATLSLTVTNNSDADLVLDPTSDSPNFGASATPAVVPPDGESIVVVSFYPAGTTAYAGVIDLGPAACSDVQVYGQGAQTGVPGINKVGIFFDHAYSENQIWVWQPGTVVTGHLVLHEPGPAGGLLGWECRPEMTGPAVILGWTLDGQAINVGQAPDMVVGLATPLPHGPYIKLASFQCLVMANGEEIVFSLLPTRLPSVPGQMSWVPGSDPGALIPMTTIFGVPEVAVINGGVLAVTAPTPLVQVIGRRIDLSWPVPTAAHDGCHVYRRLDGRATADRLTTTPLVAQDAQFMFSDPGADLPAGGVVHYSYAIMSDGVEQARSAEVRITVPRTPALATRLLPNVPNPFNPMTEIRFELGESHPVSLRIYDITGRLVKVLAEGTLPAGPHTRLWQGRDEHDRQVPSGAYYVRLVTDRKIDSRKILLLK